ncbi:MAG: glycosyltransferase, partial [Myxococcota bacterium]
SYETSRGPLKWAIQAVIRRSCRCAHRVITICHELRQTCQDDRLCDIDKVRVILAGSSNGIDLKRFTLTDSLRDSALKLRQQAGVPENAVVVGMVARLMIEKGVCELIEAFRKLESRWPDLWLLFVGPFEALHHPLPPEIQTLIRTHPRIWYAGFQKETERYYAAMDVFALPSYREGFGSVIIEASALERPVITSDIMGCREACADGESGLLVSPRNAAALTEAVERLLADPDLRERLGRQGRRRVEEKFDQQKYWPAMDAVFRELLQARSCPLPEKRDRGAAAEVAGVEN